MIWRLKQASGSSRTLIAPRFGMPSRLELLSPLEAPPMRNEPHPDGESWQAQHRCYQFVSKELDRRSMPGGREATVTGD
jgi:hypothetical protein